jgi:hypothetical protein
MGLFLQSCRSLHCVSLFLLRGSLYFGAVQCRAHILHLSRSDTTLWTSQLCRLRFSCVPCSFLRARGVIESLFLRVGGGARSEEFSFWGYGDKDLVRGSGIFVPETGVVTNHHFNPLHTDSLFGSHTGHTSWSLSLTSLQGSAWFRSGVLPWMFRVVRLILTWQLNR